jgi:hypothetical protein|eukprot:scaffold2794_cov259-Alexandrium_tamarense.AAC.6
MHLSISVKCPRSSRVRTHSSVQIPKPMIAPTTIPVEMHWNSSIADQYCRSPCVNAMIQKHRSGRRLIATDVLSKIPTLPFQLASATQTKQRVPSSKATTGPIKLDEPRKSSLPQAHTRRRLTYSARTTSDPLAMKLPNSRRVSISHLHNRNQSFNARCA